MAHFKKIYCRLKCFMKVFLVCVFFLNFSCSLCFCVENLKNVIKFFNVENLEKVNSKNSQNIHLQNTKNDSLKSQNFTQIDLQNLHENAIHKIQILNPTIFDENCIMLDTRNNPEVEQSFLKNFSIYNSNTKQMLLKNNQQNNSQNDLPNVEQNAQKNVQQNNIQDDDINVAESKKLDNKIHICFTCDDNFAMPLAVTIASILLSGAYDDKFYFYVIDDGISQENKQKILHLKNQIRNFQIKFLKINQKIQDVIFKLPIKNTCYTRTVYARYFLPELLFDLDKVLFLDCDIVVKKSLKTLWNFDVSDVFFSMSHDVFNLYAMPSKKSENGMNYIYGNSGVLLINLKKWREESFTQKFLENITILDKAHGLGYPDQDVLNYTVNEKKLLLPARFNYLIMHTYIIFIYDLLKNVEKKNLKAITKQIFPIKNQAIYEQMTSGTIENYVQYLSNEQNQIVCIHYANSLVKPWYWNSAPYRVDDFYDIVKLTDYWDNVMKIKLLYKKILCVLLNLYFLKEELLVKILDMYYSYKERFVKV